MLRIMRSRRVLVRLHRWLSLVLGVWIVLMAVTGFILVFRADLQRMTRPELYRHAAGPAVDIGPSAAAAAVRQVLYVGDPDDFNVATQIHDRWAFPLHTGSFGGTGTRWVWLAVAAAPAALFVTGVRMALVRRRKRRGRTALTPTTLADPPDDVPTVDLREPPVAVAVPGDRPRVAGRTPAP